MDAEKRTGVVRVVARGSSDSDQGEVVIQCAEVVGVTGHDGGPSSTSAHHNMGVSDITRPAGGEETADTGRINPVESNDLGTRLT